MPLQKDVLDLRISLSQVSGSELTTDPGLSCPGPGLIQAWILLERLDGLLVSALFRPYFSVLLIHSSFQVY